MRKLTYEFVKGKFEERGYTLLSNEYTTNKVKLDYRCSKGHFGSITYSDFKRGRGCPICGTGQQAIKRRLSFSEITTAFEAEGFKVYEPEDGYKNVDQKLDFECPNGHKGSISYHNWKSGWRCADCHHINFSGQNHPMWKGGKSLEPYCEIWGDQEYKSDIRGRDGNRCLNPYCYGGDVILSIHHINYDKKDCHPSNLITVCRSCNSRANKDRRWHEAWYHAILNNRYKYNY